MSFSWRDLSWNQLALAARRACSGQVAGLWAAKAGPASTRMAWSCSGSALATDSQVAMPAPARRLRIAGPMPSMRVRSSGSMRLPKMEPAVAMALSGMTAFSSGSTAATGFSTEGSVAAARSWLAVSKPSRFNGAPARAALEAMVRGARAVVERERAFCAFRSAFRSASWASTARRRVRTVSISASARFRPSVLGSARAFRRRISVRAAESSFSKVMARAWIFLPASLAWAWRLVWTSRDFLSWASRAPALELAVSSSAARAAWVDCGTLEERRVLSSACAAERVDSVVRSLPSRSRRRWRSLLEGALTLAAAVKAAAGTFFLPRNHQPMIANKAAVGRRIGRSLESSAVVMCWADWRASMTRMIRQDTGYFRTGSRGDRGWLRG